jgi:short-subunit dehydrogenase
MNDEASRRFAKKVVVITGASAGIGEAAARAFGSEGASVVLVARTESALGRLADELKRSGVEALAVPADVGDPRAPEKVFERVLGELGGIDVLVNNAGVNYRGAVDERAAGELSHIVQVNLLAPILFTRAVIPHMRKRGGGAVINVASLAGRVPLPYEATYCATKFGLRGFSFSVAEELRGSGITVSVVSPGPVDTGFIMSGIEDVPDLVFSQPMSSADDIAKLIVDSAFDGTRERTPSPVSKVMTTLGYLLPSVARSMTPVLERRGRAAKRAYMRRAGKEV